MTTDFTRRELAQLAGTGALALSAAASIGRPTSATEAMRGSATVAQADTSSAPGTAATSDTASSVAMQRADELLRQMTVEEKPMQLSCIMPIAVLGADGPMRDQLDALWGRGSAISPAPA